MLNYIRSGVNSCTKITLAPTDLFFIQVANYGLGGLYTVHYDQVMMDKHFRHARNIFNVMAGDRMATVGQLFELKSWYLPNLFTLDYGLLDGRPCRWIHSFSPGWSRCAPQKRVCGPLVEYGSGQSYFYTI